MRNPPVAFSICLRLVGVDCVHAERLPSNTQRTRLSSDQRAAADQRQPIITNLLPTPKCVNFRPHCRSQRCPKPEKQNMEHAPPALHPRPHVTSAQRERFSFLVWCSVVRINFFTSGFFSFLLAIASKPTYLTSAPVRLRIRIRPGATLATPDGEAPGLLHRTHSSSIKQGFFALGETPVPSDTGTISQMFYLGCRCAIVAILTDAHRVNMTRF